MNKEEIEFIEGYEDLLDKGYCDCNEMNCLGYNSPKEILRIVKKLQQENKQLKEELDKYKEVISKFKDLKTLIGILDSNNLRFGFNEILQELEKGDL